MKKILILFTLLIPCLLFAQQDTKKPAIKVAKCIVSLSHKYHDKDTVPLNVFANDGSISTECGTIISYDISYTESGSIVTKRVIGTKISNVFTEFKSNPDYSMLTISNVAYKTSDGSVHYNKGLTVKVKK